MVRYYLDTCIWRDFAENRTDSHHHLGDSTRRLIDLMIDQEIRQLWSPFVERELRASPGVALVHEVLVEFRRLRLFAVSPGSRVQMNEAMALSVIRNIPPLDAVHAILARDGDAILVTRNGHFNRVRDIVDSRKPEELI